jgi:hypothetical protein
MNHSMLTCGRITHLKIVAVALIAAVLCAGRRISGLPYARGASGRPE